MAKTKTVYVCSNCGADSPKWLGKCPNCGEWNTYVEEIVTKEPAMKWPVPGNMEGNKIRPVLLRDITTEEEPRIDLKDDELKSSTLRSPLKSRKSTKILSQRSKANSSISFSNQSTKVSTSTQTVKRFNFATLKPLETCT